MSALLDMAQAPLSRGVALMRRLAQRSSSNFKFAFLFLRPEQRDALKQVYEFCRVVDDIVDERPPGKEGEQQARDGLAMWRQEIARIKLKTQGMGIDKLSKEQIAYSTDYLAGT